MDRDYILIMDQSGSMAGARWEQAKAAVMQIAPFACQADPDGITLYLFHCTSALPPLVFLANVFIASFTVYRNIRVADQVRGIFERERPMGTTNLAGVLQCAFQEHFQSGKYTTILVITDGEPNSKVLARN